MRYHINISYKEIITYIVIMVFINHASFGSFVYTIEISGLFCTRNPLINLLKRATFQRILWQFPRRCISKKYYYLAFFMRKLNSRNSPLVYVLMTVTIV